MCAKCRVRVCGVWGAECVLLHLLLGTRTASDGNGRSGRDVGNECVRGRTGFGCAEAASGDDTRGRVAAGAKGEGAGTAVMREAVVKL